MRLVVVEVDSPGQLNKLTRMNLDIAAIREGQEISGPRGLSIPSYRVEVVVSTDDLNRLSSEGFSWSETQSSMLRAANNLGATAYNVYHSYDEPVKGIRAQLRRLENKYPRLTEVKSIGRSLQGRPILAIRLTNERGRHHDKPQVLLIATTHAREWISTEVAMRLIKYLTANYKTDSRVTNLLDTTEIWIIPVVNPDGYEYTFTTERLWRKNLRDNDGDGKITLVDGVDINRNFDSSWGYDNEGSSPVSSNETFRGSAPNSEPETKALIKFIDHNKFKFIVSYHSYSNLILYPWGWQVKTPSFDDPIFVAQAGTDDNPAIQDSLLGVGYDPGVGADLYITNGEFTDWTYSKRGIPAYTVELTLGQDSDGNIYGFEFPDDEGMVQTVFQDNLEFALSVAESAKDPAHPVSPVDIPAEDVYHTPVEASYGSDQIIQIVARKGLKLSLNYSIDGGHEQKAKFKEKLGEFYNDQSGVYYSQYEAVIKGQQAGNNVTYRIVGKNVGLGPYSYTVNSATGHPILVIAAEDYTGTNPVYADPTQPNYLQYYTAALDAGGYEYDVWNVDVQGIPTYADVLSHYKTVIWYTGDDYAARVPLGLATQEQEVLNIRDFINYKRGKVFATGQDLAWLATAAAFYSDDFFQYYLGAYTDLDTAGIDTDGLPFNIKGEPGDPIFEGLNFSLYNNDPDDDGANNQCCSSTFVTTNYFVPHFDTTLAARYDRPGGPFDPHSGSYYVFSQIADESFKRLGGTFNIPGGSPSLKFWLSADTEADWDFVFVEVSQAGSGVWTTLPDVNGLTTTNTGQSCLSGWVDQIHPHLANYMDAACNPTGTTGSWNAFSGNSGGWYQVEVDLSAYAGQTVELYISYASDWATQGLGVFIDDIELSSYALEDFEGGLGQWAVSAGPGNAPFNNWERITGAGFPEGPAIRTPYSVYLGFGFEAIDTADNRNALMDRVMEYLGH